MDFALTFTGIGALFLLGLAADALGRRTRLPRVTMLLILGALFGGAGLGVVPEAAADWEHPLSVLALTMVAFLLGSTLRGETLRAHGRAILAVSAAIVVTTVALVSAGLWLIGLPLAMALILGTIASATAPASTRETLEETGAKGDFADTVSGVVAIDDAWGMIVFALAVVTAQALNGDGMSVGHLLDAGRDIGGALALGLVLGLPGAYLTGRLRPGRPMQTEALGLVFLCAGLALWLEVSFLLAGMTAGAVIVNLAQHHERAFHEIEHIEWPFLTLFFLLAGAQLDLGAALSLGGVGLTYVVLRIVARLAGGWIGGLIGGMPPRDRLWIGPALLPQAGVAVGMALVAAQEFPDFAAMILTLTVGTTVLFELIGPVATAYAVRRVSR
ncbi:cation:proton antiporter [Aestuariicoccus sp. MJ-SS9]|uniref:cation:proton antiporter n=1 Tax=Aestuariicoccus sp. MJ-SS9 TaxID=3079855 RepID=UPI00290B6D92|nr:cation:proton antiporter [Aestuariicoccus sp. MJ-SS9]MDU8913907.1 cation:proton antiporter [Aestuariicoccus sp. MJ-SS9]